MPYAAARDTNNWAHDSSKPNQKWPSMLKTEIATAKRRKPPSRSALDQEASVGIFQILRMPPGAKSKTFLVNTARVAPADGYVQERILRNVAKSEVKVGAALARVPAAAVYLRIRRVSIGKLHRGPSADCRPVVNAKPESQKLSGIRAFVVNKNRRLPLIRNRIIQAAVAVHVGDCDSAAYMCLAQAHVFRQIVIAAVRSTHKERIMITA